MYTSFADFNNEIQAFLDAGKKIQAIKALRSLCPEKYGLKEAKQAIDYRFDFGCWEYADKVTLDKIFLDHAEKKVGPTNLTFQARITGADGRTYEFENLSEEAAVEIARILDQPGSFTRIDDEPPF